MQVEVAALALQAGWAVRLEPPPSELRGRKVDLLVMKGTQTIAVEVKTLITDELMREDVGTSRLIGRRLMGFSAEHLVRFHGQINQPESLDELAALNAWIDTLEQTAVQVRESGSPSSPCTPPTGGHLVVLPDGYEGPAEWSMPIRAVDPLGRLLGKIADKAAQGQGDTPLWLRVNETSEFFRQLIPDQEPARSRGRDNLIRALERNLALYPHVAGLVLSSEPISYSPEVVDTTVRLPCAAIAVLRTTQRPWFRSTLIVRGPSRGEAISEQTLSWVDWYSGEGDWLDWGLNRFGLPPLSAILA